VRALWWWIDRWRKSTAYTDMTLEEQAAYRNLLDEIALRDGVIPDDERTLARASGDATRWPRVREKVLRWLQRCEGGWTNETALEVIRQGQRRADKQQRYRSRRRNGPGNAGGNAGGNGEGDAGGNNAGNQAGYPSPSPSPSQRTDNGLAATTRRVAAKVVKRKPPSWSAEACDDWLKRFPGSSPPGARIGAALKPLVTAHGWPGVRPVWGFYLASTPADFLNPQTFAAKFGEFQRRMAGGAPRDTPARHFRSEQALSLLEDDDGE